MAALGPVLPGLAQQTSSGLSQISYLFTSRSLGYLIGSVIAGQVYDHISGHRLMALALTVLLLILALVPFTPYLLLLLLLLLVIGISEATVDIGGNSLLVRLHGARVAPVMNALHFFFGVGAFLAPIFIAQLLSRGFPSAWVFPILSALIMPAAVILARLPSPKAPVLSADQKKEGKPSALIIALIAVVFFLYVGVEVGLSGWIYTYALSMKIGSEVSAAYLTSAYWAAFTVGRLSGVPLARRYKPAVMLVMDIIGLMVAFALLAASPADPVILWIGTILAGLFSASFFPTLLSFAGQHMTVSARITGHFFIGSSLGAMIIPWLIGQLIVPYGPLVLVWAMVVDVILLAASFGLLLLKVRARHPKAAVTY